MATFYNTDTPAGAFVFDVPADITAATAVSLTVNGQTLTADTDGDTITGQWDGMTIPAAGAYPVFAVFTIGDGTATRLIATLVIEDTSTGWLTVDQARAIWNGAPDSDGDLYRLLVVAQTQVQAYAPALADGASVPETYRQAQYMQARNTWNASKVDPSTGGVDMGGMSFVVRPLDWTVKQLLRPKRALPEVG